MTEPRNLEDFVGLRWGQPWPPIAAVSCWSLVVGAYARLFGLDLPRHDGVDPLDAVTVAGLIDVGKTGWVHVDLPGVRFGDVLLFRHEHPTLPTHCGLALDAARMLHVERGGRSGIAWWDDSWRGRVWNRRLDGAWRHVGLV